MSKNTTLDTHKPPAHEIKTDREKLARALYEILDNPQTPVALYNSVGDLTLALCMPLLDYSPEIIEKALLRDGVSRESSGATASVDRQADSVEPETQTVRTVIGETAEVPKLRHEQIKSLAEVICMSGDEPERKSEALLVLMHEIAEGNGGRAGDIAFIVKHAAFARLSDDMLDAHAELLRTKILTS